MHKDRPTDFQDILKGCYRDERSSQNALYRLFYPYGMSIAIRYVNTEGEAVSIDELSSKAKRAAELIKLCREKLRHTDQELKGLFDQGL